VPSTQVNILASTDAGTHSIDIIDVNEVTMDQIAADAGKGLVTLHIHNICFQPEQTTSTINTANS